MPDITITGEVVEILPIETFNLKNGEVRSKRSLVIKTKEEYPQMIRVDFQKENLSIIEELKIGEWVHANTSIRGYCFKKSGIDTYGVNLSGWRLAKTNNPNVYGAPPVPTEAIQNTNNGFTPNSFGNNNDDLPF